MIFNTKAFAKKYAVIYTAILATLLLVPLLVYVLLLLQIDAGKTQLSLKQHSQKILSSMQSYENKDEVYHFPRYKVYQSALYDRRYQEIFSTLTFRPMSFSEGFHEEEGYTYYLYSLPSGYYFDADFLLVAKENARQQIYYFAMIVMVLIIFFLFMFSYLLLKNFSEPLENLNRQLDNFIKDSMHEINTPLSIINLNADLFALKYGENKYLWRIKSASKTLATIYNDMDYLVKQGRVEYPLEVINMSDFIQSRVEYFQEIAHLKNIGLRTEIDPDIYHTYAKTKLQRIVDNTLSNAIKYSHDNDSIEIVLHADASKITFEVRDKGVGIEDISKIFSRYYRENQAKGGFGIGLNIVKEIIDEDGITLDVRSVVGEGTVFCYGFLF